MRITLENVERIAWMERFGITNYDSGRLRAMWDDGFLRQLSRCKDDSARRLLLGIGERMEATCGD